MTDLTIYPQLFGPHVPTLEAFQALELRIQRGMAVLCRQDVGRAWTLTIIGHSLWLTRPDAAHIHGSLFLVDRTGRQHEVSRQAAGIAAMLHAIRALIVGFVDDGKIIEQEAAMEHYDRLMEYARHGEEGDAIAAALA